MTHPLVPQITELATPVAAELGLDVVNIVFHTNQSPPVLRVDVRNDKTDTSLNDCETMSRALEEALEATALIPDAYVLEVSSPGLSDQLMTDRDFISFRGFPVEVETAEPHKGKTLWQGNLIGRDEKVVSLSLKGRTVAIPKHLITCVQLTNAT